MDQALQPPDLDEARHLVDSFMARHGVGHWPRPRARFLMGVIGGRATFSEAVNHVASRLSAPYPRHAAALAVSLAASAPPPPPPPSTVAGPLWALLAAETARLRGHGPYATREATRQDRLAFDLVVAAATRSAPWPATWEVPRYALAVIVEVALERLARNGLDVGVGPVPRSPSIPHRAERVAAALAEATCGCGGGDSSERCATPAEHSLAAWDPAYATLAAFVDRAVAGARGDGRLSLTTSPLAATWGRR